MVCSDTGGGWDAGVGAVQLCRCRGLVFYVVVFCLILVENNHCVNKHNLCASSGVCAHLVGLI